MSISEEGGTMLFQLTDMEYIILDGLADGPQPMNVVVRELRRLKQTWDPAGVMAAMTRLAESQLIRCTLAPGAPVAVHLSSEILKLYASHFPAKQERVYWLELTDGGKDVWESWRQAA